MCLKFIYRGWGMLWNCENIFWIFGLLGLMIIFVLIIYFVIFSLVRLVNCFRMIIDSNLDVYGFIVDLMELFIIGWKSGVVYDREVRFFCRVFVEIVEIMRSCCYSRFFYWIWGWWRIGF